MEYLHWLWFAFIWFLTLWILSFFVRLVLPYYVQEALGSLDLFFVNRIFSIPVVISNVWFFAANILYFAGNFAVLLLLVFGLFILSYSIHLHLANIEFTFVWWYQLGKQLVDEKTAWSGATMIVGATVAMAHMWKLNQDRKQYLEKRERDRRERYRRQLNP